MTCVRPLNFPLLILPLFVAAIACGATSGQAPGNAQACRMVASAYSSSTGAGGFKSTVTASCSFDTPGKRASCTYQYSDTTGTSSTSTSVTLYKAIADFVDEVQDIPPLMKAQSSTGTMVSRNATTTGSSVNTYDGQGRITRTDNNKGLPGASTTTYAAWDLKGRPTVANDVGSGFKNRRDIAYDDLARTRTTRVNGGVVVTVETFDANGNLVLQTATGGGAGSTTTFTTTATRRLCK